MEAAHVEEDGLVVEEELGEEGEVLGEKLRGAKLISWLRFARLQEWRDTYLVLLAINFVYGIRWLVVNQLA